MKLSFSVRVNNTYVRLEVTISDKHIFINISNLGSYHFMCKCVAFVFMKYRIYCCSEGGKNKLESIEMKVDLASEKAARWGENANIRNERLLWP